MTLIRNNILWLTASWIFAASYPARLDADTPAAKAPTVTTGAATAIKANSATLGGTINPNGLDTHVWFLYGTSKSLNGASQTLTQDLGSGTTISNLSVNLSGLAANTTYYFELLAINSSGIVVGTVGTFVTLPLSPVVSTGQATAIAGNTATLSGTVNANGLDTHFWFLYGTSSSLKGASQTSMMDLGSGASAFTVSLTAGPLAVNTTYYFQIQASNTAGTATGAIASFTTQPSGPKGYSGSAIITIDHRKVSNTDQVNFPVLVVGTSPTLKLTAKGGQMSNPNGYDILFTSDQAGTKMLPYERELHDTVGGRVVYWVQVPLLSHTVDTPIYVWFGNPAVTTDQSKPAAVWDSNYTAVWHLNDNAANRNVLDSTGKHNGVNQVNTGSRAAAGPLPNTTALTYTGTSDYTVVASTPGGDLDFTSGNFSYEFWLRINSFSAYMSYFGNGTWLKNGYYLQENGGGHMFQFVSDFNNLYAGYQDSQVATTGVWRHVVVARQGSNLAIYVNGVLDKLFNNFVSSVSSMSPFTLGGTAGQGTGFQGSLQEFRVSGTNRSADWVATEYANQGNIGSFFSQMPWSTTSSFPPVCGAGVSQVFQSGQPASLDGSASYPRDGQGSLSYLWQQIPSQAAGVPMNSAVLSPNNVARPSVIGFSSGPLNLQLTVTQSDGQSTSCFVNDGAVATDSTGAVKISTGNPTLDNAVHNLLGPMVPLGRNPWPYYDTANQNDANIQIANMDSIYGDFWNNAGPGAISVTTGSLAVLGNGTTFTTTFCQGPVNPTVPRPGIGLIVWYPTNDGTGRLGRRLAGYFTGPGAAYIQSCTDDTHMKLATNSWYGSEASCSNGQAAPCWLQYSVWGAWPSTNAWIYGAAPADYYDVVSAYYALYFRSGLDIYLVYARKLADRYWSSPEFDLGNAFDSGYPLFGFQPQFRCWSIQGLVLRALDTADGHPDMWAGLHKVWNMMMTNYWLGTFPSSPFQNMIDQREWGYGLAQLADCAMYDTNLQYQQTCRNYIKNSFAGSGAGALNVWPSRQDPSGAWLTWYASKSSAVNHVNLTAGSKMVSCANSNCNWAPSDFPAGPQNNVWFFSSSLNALPANNGQGDPDTYCYQPGSNAACTFVDSNHFMLDRPYDGASCTPNCTRGWAFGLAGSGAVGWGAEPFFEGILGFAFDWAGRAMACTSTNVPVGCDNATSAAAYQASTSAVKWMINHGYRAATDGMYYYAGFMGCASPISEQNGWCTNGNELSSREYAGDGMRGMMVYYERTHDPAAKIILDNLYAGLWGKPGTGAILPSPDGIYDSNFDTCNGCGYWLTAGPVANKLFGQMFGFGALYSWPAARMQ